MKAMIVYLLLIGAVVAGLNWFGPDFRQTKNDLRLIDSRISEMERALRL